MAQRLSFFLSPLWYYKYMPILYILAVIVVVGVVAWGIQKIPMDATIRSILHVVIVILLVLFLFSLFIDLGPIFNARVGGHH